MGKLRKIGTGIGSALLGIAGAVGKPEVVADSTIVRVILITAAFVLLEWGWGIMKYLKQRYVDIAPSSVKMRPHGIPAIRDQESRINSQIDLLFEVINCSNRDLEVLGAEGGATIQNSDFMQGLRLADPHRSHVINRNGGEMIIKIVQHITPHELERLPMADVFMEYPRARLLVRPYRAISKGSEQESVGGPFLQGFRRRGHFQ